MKGTVTIMQVRGREQAKKNAKLSAYSNFNLNIFYFIFSNLSIQFILVTFNKIQTNLIQGIHQLPNVMAFVDTGGS